VAGPLQHYVSGFVDGVEAELAALSGRRHVAECVLEARDLVSAILASDGRFTTSELEAWLDDVGTRLDPPVNVTPQQLRQSDLLTAHVDWHRAPSTLFDLLVRADARDGRHRSTAYYELALKLAHASAALDLVPSPDEIAAIDTLRTTLLLAMDAHGVARPGRPTTAAPGGPNQPSTAGAGTEPAHESVELPPDRPVEEILAELDVLIGLDHVKTEVRRLTSLLRVQQLRADQGLPVIETSRHLVFVGNPGTGKTTVARLLSQLYRSLDVVTTGHLVETDRSDLVAGYVGQTATKTRAVLESALGGTVLIDEAYALARGGENDFGREAIDTLVKFMEDHRDDLAVVVAGYPDEMQQLIDTNPGLKSRFARTLDFPDYTSDELVRIFELIAGKQEYHLSPDARTRLVEVIDAEPRSRGFGNARFVRNVFEQAVSMHAVRLTDVDQPTRDQLTVLDPDDIAPV
jgi:energy-coupling factor transporter ATP-binding protein EcfA2